MIEKTMTHTDIKMTGWITRLPAAMRPYALLMRLDRPVGTWLLLLPGWWSIVLASGGFAGLDRQGGVLVVLFAFGAVIMRGAGCVINDLWDRDLDAHVTRTRGRPLASGALSPRQGVVFLVVLLFLGLSVLLQLDRVAIGLGVLSLFLVVVYPYMKRIIWWPQAFLGVTFNFGALMGWAAVTGTVSPAAILLYVAGFFWTLGYDTIYAHQDREDDMRVGIKSTAIRFGVKSKIWVAGFYAMTCVLLLAAFALTGAGAGAFLFLGAAALQLYWQVYQWSPEDPASSLAIFRSSRDFGLIVALAAVFSGF